MAFLSLLHSELDIRIWIWLWEYGIGNLGTIFFFLSFLFCLGLYSFVDMFLAIWLISSP